MNDLPRPAPLLHAVGIRLAAIALGLMAVMVAVTIAEYAGDLQRLRRTTLEEQAEDVFGFMRSGHSGSFIANCMRYPKAYGYRIFDDKNEIIAQANGELFPEMPRYRSGRPDLSFKHWRTPDPWNDQWFLTRQEDIAGRPLWIHVTMVGDPAALWTAVLLEEIMEHVVVQAMIAVPALGLAIFWALRSALQPLTGIAERARRLAQEANSGKSPQALQSEGLPSEAQDLVKAINVLLGKYEATVERQTQFAANAAHELRTPLAVLLLQISQLPASKAVDRLKADVAVMAHTVDQLLRLAQVEQLAKAGFSLCDLREVGRAACEEMAVPATSRGLLIEFDEASTPVMIPCSPEFMQIAIRNVVDNSLHAAPRDSMVSVMVNAAGDVIVSDRGPGVPDIDKERIYQRLWTRRPGEGAGIGLALVRRIMDLHGGEVRIEDREGGGARVILSNRHHSRGGDQLGRSSAFCGRARFAKIEGESPPHYARA